MGRNADEATGRLRQRLSRLVPDRPDATASQVVEETYRRLGEAPSLVLAAPLEDALAVEERPNMPGTTAEWPNWSLALPGGIEGLENAELPRRIAAALCRSGNKAPKNAVDREGGS
jgi:4-alpha-glucanotransferase